MITEKIPVFNDILLAHKRIKSYIHRTPVMTSLSIDRMFDNHLFFKCENFQKAGAFKFRGATNSVLSLTGEEAKHGVATHSSGNHAAALALAAKIRGIRSYIVMPVNSSEVKKKAVEAYGAEITFCKPTLEAREQTLIDVVARTSAIFIHPYNYFTTICGQGTAVLELLQDVPDLEMIIAPVGGGGLMSGTAIAAKGFNSSIRVIAAEPENAGDAYRSFTCRTLLPSVNPNTIADGLLTSLGSITFDIILDKVNDIVTVSEEAIINAMRLVWERMKIIIEPSAAVPVAALLENKIRTKREKIGIIISGGNVDLSKLPF
jgi:threonine dehydratase